MNAVYINGTGIVSRCGCDISKIIHIENEQEFPVGKIEYEKVVSSSKLRRCSDYTKMAVNTAALAIKDYGIELENEKVGTIISTGFGAVSSNITFSDSVAKGNPQMCSPTVFSATVPNSCVGQICIINGFKGPSTVLTGGDPLEYSSLLINTSRTDTVLCGSVEEYNEELADSIKRGKLLDNTDFSEGAAMLIVSKKPSENTYCKVTEFNSCTLSKYPYIHDINLINAERSLESVLSATSIKPDFIINSFNGSYFDKAEKNAIENVFGNVKTFSPKKIFGETFGCGYMFNIVYGAAYLKENKDSIKSVLVTGIDVHGNYLTVLLEV